MIYMVGNRILYATLMSASIFFTTNAGAEDMSNRPTMSEAYEMPNALEAFKEVKIRWDAAQIKMQNRFAKHKGSIDDFKRTDPVLQQVSWRYGACTDLVSLIPPPMSDWGIRSEAPFKEVPLSEERAQVSLVYFDPNKDPSDSDFFKTEESVFITLTASPDSIKLLELSLAEPIMREAQFKPGPYNYPVLRYGNGTLLGNYVVDVTGTSEINDARYLEEMIRCAIDGGLIAKGIDPDSLTDAP